MDDPLLDYNVEVCINLNNHFMNQINFNVKNIFSLN